MSYRKLLFLFACIVSLSATAKSTVHNYLVVEPKNPKVLLKELNAPQYTELRPDKEYRFGVGLYGYKDASGKSVIEPQFFAASDFGDGLAAVKRQEKDKWGYIDNTGKMVIEPQFYVAEKFSEGLAPVRLKKNGKWGYIDKSGKMVIEPQFYDAGQFSDGLAAVRLKAYGDFGYIDKSGKFIIEPKYRKAQPFDQGLAVVTVLVVDKTGGSSNAGVIDKSGNFVVEPKYVVIRNFSEGLAPFATARAWGYIDKSGKEVVPAIFEQVTPFRNGIAHVITKNSRGIFDEFITLNPSFSNFLEIECGSLDSYLAASGLAKPDEASMRAEIETKIAQWQKKGEFESTQKWQARVNEASRAKKAKALADSISADFTSRAKIAAESYKDHYKECVKRYCEQFVDTFRDQEMTLRPYDPDNQTFLISTADFGDVLLPVPVSEAPKFKERWAQMNKFMIKPEFIVAGDKAALKSVTFFDKYKYDSNTKADYAQVDIDYNFKPIDVANLDLGFGEIGGDKRQTAHLTTPEASSAVVAPRDYTPDTKKLTAGNASDVDVDIPATGRRSDNTFAVIIANSDYAHASKVANATNDGRVMEKYLNRTLGIPEKNITTYIDATYGQMASAMSHLRDIAEAYGNGTFDVIFYYVGHGLPDDESRKSYILPVDVDPRNTDVCYPLDKLYGQLGELGANSVTVLIDACFSGANHGDGMLLAQSMGVALRPKAVSPTGNMVVLSAAQGDETAYPYAAQNHGLFTYWLLKKLKESRGDVSLGDLSDYVTENVRKTSVIENRKMQNPAVAVSPALTTVWRALPLVK